MSETWIDRKWISIVGQQLDQFKWTGNGVANCRCPICGDSETSNTKARGYFIVSNGIYLFKCHNCGKAMPFNAFLKHEFPAIYDDYKLDAFESSMLSGSSMPALPDIERDEPAVPVSDIENAVCIADVSPAHRGYQYLNDRHVPTEQLKRVYFTDNFRQSVTETTRSSRYKKLPQDERILLPLRDQKGELIGMQGRRIAAGKSPKYITIKFDPEAPKVFGLEAIDKTKPVIVVEGPLDALFLPNAIAICGGDVNHSLKPLIGTADVYVALDNERRNPDTIARMKAALLMGFRVVFWQHDQQFNDINDMVIHFGRRNVIKHIVNHAYSGEAGKLELQTWKRCQSRSATKRGHQPLTM